MTPYELAQRVYQSEPCARTFAQDMEWHLCNGFVYSTPEYFAMGRPVVRTAPTEILVGLHRFPATVCDCWHIYLVAGDMAKAWSILPWDLPWVSMERKNVLKFYRLDSIRRLSGARPIIP